MAVSRFAPKLLRFWLSVRCTKKDRSLKNFRREFEILRMILEARTTDEIASAFHVSRKTVANYHYNIKSKLNVSSDIELLYYGLQHGVITPIAPLRLDLEK